MPRLLLRRLQRNPLLAANHIATIALGMTALTAVVSLMRAVAFQPLPFSDSSQVVQVWNRIESGAPIAAFSGAELVEIQQGTKDVFAHLGGFTVHSFSLLDERGDAIPLRVTRLEPAAFRALDLMPTLGRPDAQDPGISADDLGPVWLSSRLWQSHFGARDTVVGERIRLALRSGDRMWATVVGVMPADARVPHPSFEGVVDLWAVLPEALKVRASRASVFFALGRLQSNRDIADAQAALSLLADRRSSPEDRRNRPTVEGAEKIALGPAQETLGILALGVALVVLLAFANLASLNIAEGNRRRLELSIRASLGATPNRLWRDVLVEQVVLTTCALIVGLPLAWLAIRGLTDIVTLADIGPPIAHPPSLDVSVILGFASCTLAATLAWSALLVRQTERRRSGGAIGTAPLATGATLGSPEGASFWRLGVLAAQACVGIALMVLAVSLTGRYVLLTAADLGPAPEKTLLFSVRASDRAVQTAAQAADFNTSVIALFRGRPGVTATALVDSFPPFGSPMAFWKHDDLVDAPRQTTQPVVVSNDYFGALGIPILFGRSFSESDRRDGKPVAIVDLEMARRNWRSADEAVNAQIKLGGAMQPYEVIGVSGSFGGYWAQALVPTVYLSQNQNPSNGGHLIVRTDGSVSVTGNDARQALASLPGQPVVSAPTTLQAEWQATTTRPRARMVGMLLLGLIGLALGIQGVYALAASTVASRRLELALRIALGASRRNLVGLVLRQIMLAVAVGSCAGVLIVLAVERVAPHWLSAALIDPVPSIGLAMAILLLTALVGGLVPARSATRANSVGALIRH